MTVVFNTYPMAYDVPGGGEMQIAAYKNYLRLYDVQASLFNLWDPDLSSFDIVHFFSVISGSGHFCKYVKDRKKPLAITSSLWITESTKSNYPYEEIKWQLSLANKIIVNSKLEATSLSEVFRLPMDLFHVVYNGIDAFYTEPSNDIDFRNYIGISDPYVLNIGNIEPRKNQLSLIEAMKAFPSVKLVLIGHPRDSSYTRSCLELGGSQLIYCGALRHESPLLRSAMAGCAAFVMPSKLETPGLAALEAAAQGANIVITRNGCAAEYFLDHVQYVEPTSVSDIRDAIYSALNSKPTAALREHICSHYLWRNVVNQLVVAYRDICGQ